MRLVDLAEHPDDAALARFYNDMIVPAFPSPDELDDLEDWQIGLSKHRQASGGAGGQSSVAGALGPGDAPHPLDPELHIVIAVEDGTEDGQHHGSLAGARQLGGGVYEWYPGPQGGTALLSYLVTSPQHQKRGVARGVIKHISAVLSSQGVSVLIAETHKMLVDDGTGMDPKQRHLAFHRLGFAPVQMRYAQPPVRVDSKHSDDLLLIAHCPLLLEKAQKTAQENRSRSGAGDSEAPPDGELTIPSDMLLSYFDGFCGSVFGFDNRELFETEPWYVGTTGQLGRVRNVRVLRSTPPPWEDSVCEM